MKKVLLLILIFSFSYPIRVFAHGVGQVYALPVPLKYYLIGAGLAVAFSFFVIAFFIHRAPQSRSNITLPTRWMAWLIRVLKGVSVGLLILTVITGVIGSQNPMENFTPVFFWVYFIIGMGLLSIFVGNLWDKINPWRTLNKWAGFTPGKKKLPGIVGVILLLALFWFELVSGVSFVPRVVGMLLAVYTVVNMIMSTYYSNWYKDGEVFSVLFGFVGNIARYKIGDDNISVILNRDKQQQGAWWLLGTASVLLAGASFDSVKETVMWFNFLERLGLASNSLFAPTLGILLSLAPFLLAYLGAIWIMKKLVRSELSVSDLAMYFVWSLIPIAFGYTLAHNFALTIVTGPQLLALISDPFGFGWNIFGTAKLAHMNVLLGARTVWFIEIGFIIAAHIGGVLYAHLLALNVFKSPQLALKSQYPLAALMVGFTVVTLWLLSQPLVV